MNTITRNFEKATEKSAEIDPGLDRVRYAVLMLSLASLRPRYHPRGGRGERAIRDLRALGMMNAVPISDGVVMFSLRAGEDTHPYLEADARREVRRG